jgi:hypothetical protein
VTRQRASDDPAAGLTLAQLLEASGAQLLVVDVGRRIGPLALPAWRAFEAGETPYPQPMQRKAWVGLVQSVESQEPVVWFLRLGLDERGLLVQAERDYLLTRLLESATQPTGAAQDFLADNPCAFQPKPERMALFHAVVGATLDRPPSRFFAHAADYLAGNTGWEQWSFVGYQGIADAALRLDDAVLANAVTHLPDEPLLALCHCLESRAIAPATRDALIARLSRATGQTADPATCAALVRGLAGSAGEPPVVGALLALLDSPAGADIEVLAAIAGRTWEALHDAPLRGRFLQRLATNRHGHAAFRHTVDDLLRLPGVAPDLRLSLRADDAPAEVKLAFSRMLQAAVDGDDSTCD